MFYAPGLLYLHLPRTGGTFICDVLELKGLGSRQLSMEIGGHDGVRAVPENIREQSLVFASLRDPWSWYFSIDAHYRHRGRFDGFLHEMVGKAVPFKEVMRAFTRPGECPLPKREKNVRYPGSRFYEERFQAKLMESGVGLYTWLVLRMFCSEPFESVPDMRGVLEQCGDVVWDINAVIDTAQVREGLGVVLDAWRPGAGEELRSELQTHPPKNEKSRYRGVLPTGGPDPAVYDQECQQWVWESDGWLMRRFGFDRPVGQRPAVTLLGR